jgi:hypothetical protein
MAERLILIALIAKKPDTDESGKETSDNETSCPADKNSTSKAVLKTAGVLGGTYLLYRGIRMLPSLAPPLWWTIPANVVTP